MPRYIDKEQAYDRQTLYDWYISSVCDGDPVWTEEHLDELLNDFLLIPKDAPTVDAVEVVRCRDCKHHREKVRSEASAYFEDVVICTNGEVGADGWLPVFENYFCAYGERRNDG